MPGICEFDLNNYIVRLNGDSMCQKILNDNFSTITYTYFQINLNNCPSTIYYTYPQVIPNNNPLAN